ncbi:formiminoglutamase [Vibrio maritimus]|uniref:Formimidoylglutamase n=1 Tax=Vibrio maritimus TaxID=990268 RepID=A0A090T9V6_9VIBR|nr:formiminoglutamase [Vibrio maritimus]
MSSNNQFPFNWIGRDDQEDGNKRYRVHHKVVHRSQGDTPQIQLMGFCTDEGVKRNKGRVGAQQGPNAIRAALANLAWHQDNTLLDIGNVIADSDDLERHQQQAAETITKNLFNGPIVVLGGGHEIAWPSFKGLSDFLSQSSDKPNIGIINFDAHFDLREYQSNDNTPADVDLKPSSGTPFAQIADHCHLTGQNFHYFCLGVSETGNTQALFEKADNLQVQYIKDTELFDRPMHEHIAQLQNFINDVDILYFTIDLDVFNASLAPGVSAPAAFGMNLEQFIPMLNTIVASDKLMLADIAEYNPSYDIDNRTAKLAARVCWQILVAMSKQLLKTDNE